MAALVAALLLTVVCAIPLSFNTGDYVDMEQRKFAGSAVWEVVLKSEGHWDELWGVTTMGVSNKNSTELFPDGFPNGVKGIGPEACYGGAAYFWGSTGFYNYHLRASPSRMINNHVCQSAFWLTSCLLMALMMTVSASTVRSSVSVVAAARSRGAIGLRRRKIGTAGKFASSSGVSALAFKRWMYGAKYAQHCWVHLHSRCISCGYLVFKKFYNLQGISEAISFASCVSVVKIEWLIATLQLKREFRCVCQLDSCHFSPTLIDVA
jgi:hypothetical protein